MSSTTPSESAPSGKHSLEHVVEQLLFEDESNVLDFKVDQYPFGGTTDDERSELLKDILAMANSWGRAEFRYILIGVREVIGGRAKVVGVEHHLPEHAVQQLVNSRTNRPVELSYHALDYEGKSIGVFVIAKQQRPIYLQKPYGRLQANTVYLRRGSSTVISTPDEIAQMGLAGVQAEPGRDCNLLIELTTPESREPIQEPFVTCAQILKFSNVDQLPDYGESNWMRSVLPRNRHFYRDVVSYLTVSKATVPLRFHIKNAGNGAASNVTLRIEFNENSGYVIHSTPVSKPSRDLVLINALVERAEEERRPFRPKLREGAVSEIRYDLGVLQPGLALWTDPFFLVIHMPGKVEIHVETYADQLSVPKRNTFTIEAQEGVSEFHALSVVDIAEELIGDE